jgi:hypothetical protein
MGHLVFHLAARFFLTLLGLFCVLTGIALYPNEEGKIQSKFEDFWVKADDYQRLALSRHAAFMTQVAKLESAFLDRVFGPKLFSVQSIIVSCWSSVVSRCRPSGGGLDKKGHWREQTCAQRAAKSILQAKEPRERENSRLSGGGRSHMRTILHPIPC